MRRELRVGVLKRVGDKFFYVLERFKKSRGLLPRLTQSGCRSLNYQST